VSTARAGTDSLRQYLLDEWPLGVQGDGGADFTPSLGAGRARCSGNPALPSWTPA